MWMYVCKFWLIKPWSSKTKASSDLIMKAEINCSHATEFPNRSFIRSKFQTEFLSLAWFPHTDHAIKITKAIIVRLQCLPSSVVNNWNNYLTNTPQTPILKQNLHRKIFQKVPKSDILGHRRYFIKEHCITSISRDLYASMSNEHWTCFDLDILILFWIVMY